MAETGYAHHLMPGAVTDVLCGKSDVQALLDMVDKYTKPDALNKGEPQFSRLHVLIQYSKVRIVCGPFMPQSACLGRTDHASSQGDGDVF